MSLRRVTGGRTAPPGGSAGVPANQSRRLSGRVAQDPRCRAGRSSLPTASGLPADAGSRFRSGVRRRRDRLSQVVIVLRPVKRKSPSTGRRDARSIAAVGGGSIPTPATRSPEPAPRRGPRRARRRPRRGPPGPLAGRAASSSTRTGLSRERSSPSASRSCSIAGLVVEGEPGPEHRRPAAPPARRSAPTPATSWSPTSARPRSTSRVTDARRPDPRPPRRAARTSRTDRRWRSIGSRSCSASCARRRAGLPGRIWGIGIGVPGPVEFRTGRPISPPIMPGWDGYPVRERLADRYDAPVWVDNDVNVLALGEWRSRRRRRATTTWWSSRSAPASAPGSSRTGGSTAGRRGRRATSATSRSPRTGTSICRCGNVGCLEALAGGAAIARDGEAAAREGRSLRLREALDRRGAVTAEDVARAASFGDPVAVELLQAAGAPDRRDARRRRELLQPVAGRHRRRRGPERRRAAGRRSARRSTRRSLPLATRDLLIRRSSLGGLAGVIGASSMVVDQLFARESLARWAGAGEPSGMPDVVLASAG